MAYFQHPLVLLALAAVLTAVVLLSVKSQDRLFAAIARVADALSRTTLRLLLTVFLVSMSVSVVPTLIWGPPAPGVHDEFSYLLIGDTFAHGRLTNPPHPMGTYLETFHVIQSPTYASKFPIGQGVALAIGFLLGLPIAGAWLSVSAACAATAWAARGALPPRWALLAGLWGATHLVPMWWAQSYWGGGVAMLGGAILTGAALRAIRSIRRRRVPLRLGVLAGVGLAILANSRPLEGLIFAALLGAWLLWVAVRGGAIVTALTRIALPAGLVLAPVFAFMAYYNFRVTGDALTLPYALHTRQYMTAPLLRWQSPNLNQTYRHDAMRLFFQTHEMAEYQPTVGFRGLIGTIVNRWGIIARQMIQPSAVPPLIGLLFALRRRGVARWALAICLLLPTVHALVTPWFRLNYLGPMMAMFFIATMIGLRQLTMWRPRGVHVGRAVALFVVLAHALAVIAWTNSLAAQQHDPLAVDRVRMIDRMTRAGGKHLVVVKYPPGHVPLFEFVVNRADIDGSAVVFARSAGSDGTDRPLLEYFRDRHVWDLYYDPPRLRVTPR